MAVPMVATALSSHSGTSAEPSQLLQTLQEKLEKDADADKTACDKMTCFCQTYMQDKESFVSDMRQQLDSMSHDLEAQTASKARLQFELQDHQKELSEGKADLEAAKAIREKGAAQFREDEQMHVQNIGQLDSALDALGGNSPSDLALAQLRGTSQKTLAIHQADAHVSVGTSPDEIRGILKQMRTNFHETLEDVRHEESTAAAQHDDLYQAKASEIEAMQHRVEAKAQQAASVGVDVVRQQEQKEKTTVYVQSIDQAVSAMQAACSSSEQASEVRQQLRQAQLVDLQAALADLSGAQLLSTATRAKRTRGSGPEELCLAGMSLPEKEWRTAAHSACEQAREGKLQDAADAVQEIVDNMKAAQANATASAEQCSRKLQAAKSEAQETAHVNEVHASVISSDKQTLEDEISSINAQAASSEKAKDSITDAKGGLHGVMSGIAFTAKSVDDVAMHLRGKLPASAASKLAAVEESSHKLRESAASFDESFAKQVDVVVSMLDSSSRSAARLLIPLRLHRADVEEEAVNMHEKQHHAAAASQVHCDATHLSERAQQLGTQAEHLGTLASDLAYASLR